MKNILKIGVILLVTSLFVTGCGNKKSLTAEEFKNKMEKEKYIITDATNQFKDIEEAKYLKKVYIASDKDYKYQVEFYEFDTKSNATNFLEHNKNLFENEKEGASSYTEVNLFNYNRYTLNTGNKYFVLSRIDNTVVYVNNDSQYKEQINALLKIVNY